MKLELGELEICFFNAKLSNKKYVGVKIEMPGFEDCEVIINPASNFDEKVKYYKNAYNEDLTLKAFDKIKIVGFTSGDSYEEIENNLVEV